MVGSYPITITATNGVSSNATQSFTLSVVGMATTTTPTVKPTSVTHGSTVTYKATVSSSSGTPTGTVTFTIGTKTMCTANLKLGRASCSSSKAPKGSDSVLATYAGSTTYAGSAGSTTLNVVTA